MYAIDATFLEKEEIETGQVHVSFSIFLLELLEAFDKLGYSDQICVIINYNAKKFMQERFPRFHYCIVTWKPLELLYVLTKGKKTGTEYLKKLGFFRRKIKRGKFDCVWLPLGEPLDIMAKNVTYFCTIHDLMYYHGNGPKPQKRLEKVVVNSKHVVTISEFIKHDVVSSFPYDEKNITVIPNSITMSESNMKVVKGIRNKFILDINGYGKHKNTLTLIKAFHNIYKKYSDIDLVCCGGWMSPEYYDELLTYVSENGLKDRVHLLYRIPEPEKNWLLHNATVFVTPSTNEGFGRTPVEAALCKIPVISTKAASLYEVTKGLVHYYENPYDDKELTSILINVIEKPESDAVLKKISEELRETYSAINCALKYWDIFDKVREGKHENI